MNMGSPSESRSRSRFKIPVFLSYPRPCMVEQQMFVDRVCAYLDSRGMAARTLGITDYDMDAPLKAIRRLLFESNGLITVAFRRIHITSGEENHGATVAGVTSRPIREEWQTSPWAHIEPAMAYQMGLPILVLREDGVRADGMLEPGVAGVYLPSFDPRDDLDGYFGSPQWHDLIWKWESLVRTVMQRKGEPPTLY